MEKILVLNTHAACFHIFTAFLFFFLNQYDIEVRVFSLCDDHINAAAHPQMK